MSAVTVPARSAGIQTFAQTCLMAGPFLTMVDSAIVNVALPVIAGKLHASLATAQWILSGYLLALAVMLPATGYLARRFGTRRVYLASLIGFTLASALCALAPNIGWLIAARVAQGACGAPLVPLAMNLLLGPNARTDRFPVAAGVLLFLAPSLGPTLGGILIQAASWPLIFLINVPFGIIGFVGVGLTPDDATGQGDQAAHFDPIGLLLAAGGLALATYGATQGAAHGWLQPNVWPLWAGGAALLAGFVVWALVRPHPAVDLKLLRHAATALGMGVAALASIVMFAVLFLIPVFLQDFLHQSALVAGLVLLPQGLVTGLSTLLGNVLATRWGMRWCVTLGMVILAGTTAALLLVTLDTPIWVIALILSGRGLALGLAVQPLTLVLNFTLEPAEVADGNTLFNMGQRLAGSVGIALLASFFQQRIATQIATVLAAFHQTTSVADTGSAIPPALATALGNVAVQGFHETIAVLVALALGGALIALLLPGSRLVLRGRQA